MTSEKFRLEKVRDFGLLFTDTFLFIKYNFKHLIKGMMYYVLPIGLIHGVVLGLLQYQTLLPLSGTGDLGLDYSTTLIYSTIANYILILISYTFSMAFIMKYLKLYKKHGSDQFELADVWKEMLGDIPKIFGAIFLIGLISTLGFILLLIPGIYIGVCVSLVVPIIVFEEESVGDAISGCFNLIKSNWWNTFAILFVMTIVSYSINFVFQLPNFIYQIMFGIFSELGDPMSPNKSLAILFSIIQAIGNALVQMLPLTAIALQYFNLIEKRQSPALLKDLESVGNNE